MPRTYQTITESDLGSGIDNQSAENRIPSGYVEDIENADPRPTGEIRTRKGYQGFAGYVPIRVQEVEHDGTDLCFTLDSSINLASVRKTPITVYGKSQGGDFPSSGRTTKHYSTFSLDVRKVFSANTTSSITILGTEHGHATDRLSVRIVEAASLFDNANKWIEPDSISIDSTSYDITISYTNGTASDIEVFVIVDDRASSTGSTFIKSGVVISAGASTVSIPASEHGLSTYNILSFIYQDTGSELVSIFPDQVRVTPSGTVELDFTTASLLTGVIILESVPSTSEVVGTIAAGDTDSIIITGLDSPFQYVQIYLEIIPGGTIELVHPDSIIITDAGTLTATFTNGMTSAAKFSIFYQTGTVKASILCVTADASATYVDTAPELVIWGIPHSELYSGSDASRAGWVQHLDSYRSAGSAYLICGLGGNLFAPQDPSILLYPDLINRVASDVIVGPAFVGTGSALTRTRGYYQASGGGSGFLSVTTATWISGTTVSYTINAPSLVTSGTPADSDDWLTVQQMGNSRLNGTFQISSITTGVDSIIIEVTNPNVSSSDFDEVDAGGRAGIFSDKVTLLATSKFVAGDQIKDDLLDNKFALSSSGTALILNNMFDNILLPAGLTLAAKRTSAVLPVRDLADSPTVEGFVRGDMLLYSPISRQLRVKYINALGDVTLNLTSNGVTATAIMASGTTDGLAVGQKLLVVGHPLFEGDQQVTGITGQASFTFASNVITSSAQAATLVGKTLHLDEELELEDTGTSSITVQVASRWYPVEIPEDSFTNTPGTRVRHFNSNSYGEQAPIRSVMVNDSLFLTNGQDEVLKYDGQNLYRAGLFRWQPHLFVSRDDSDDKIVVPEVKISGSGTSGNSYLTPAVAGEEFTFRAGDIIRFDSNEYTVKEIDDVNHRIFLTEPLSSSAGPVDITVGHTFRYYFRLNAVDINSNIVASAIVGADDFQVRVFESCSIKLQLIGMPAWDIYNYNRLEVQIYKTRLDPRNPAVAFDSNVFYLVSTIPMSWNNGDGYISYTDTDSDEDLINLDELSTLDATEPLRAAEISEPMRAKYITSTDNRLILSNLTDYPSLDIRLFQSLNPINITALTDTDNNRYLFRKDNTDTATVSNGIDRQAYQLVSTSSGAITNADVSTLTQGTPNQFTVTLTAPPAALAPRGWIYLYHPVANTAGKEMTYTGWWQVSEVSGSDITIKLAGLSTSVPTGFPTKCLFFDDASNKDVPVLLGTDGNYGMVNGNRATGASYSFLAMRRLANAINASMRQMDITLSGQENFSPWLIASAGGEFKAGQLIIRQPKVLDTTLEFVAPSLDGQFKLFVNDEEIGADEQTSAIERLYPSRSIISYNNFPELFHNPRAISDGDSFSAVDVNSADGQQITSNIPFFGESAFGGAQHGAIVVIFKENSIYLINTVNKSTGLESTVVQRIESEGKGCTAPFSVANTKTGIMFANFTGIYRLNRNMQVTYIGRKVERIWQQELNRNQISLLHGHNSSINNHYKLAAPIGTGQAVNNEVIVYDHTREYEGGGDGSWTTYTQHSATGWANLQDNTYFSTSDGQVFAGRQAGDNTDYRDDDRSIPVSILLRALSFGDGGIRKTFGHIISHFRTLADTTLVRLKAAVNLNRQLVSTDSFRIDPQDVQTGLDDLAGPKVVSVKSSLPDRKGVYLQLKYEIDQIDAPIELSGTDVRVQGDTEEGILQARNS